MELTHSSPVSSTPAQPIISDDPREMARRKFGRLVVATRKKRGYTSAYSLFHGNGGAKRFGFTYPHFLQIEKGQRLPSIESLKRLLPVLLAEGATQERREMLELYVRASLDGEALFDIVFQAPVQAAPAADNALLERAVDERIATVPRMSHEQFDAMTSTRGAFWVFHYFQSQGGKRIPSDAAARLGLSLAEAEDAFQRLSLIHI